MSDPVRVTAHDLIALRGAGERLATTPRPARAGRAGGFRSPFKGRGMEFEESRRYQAGDDIRNMDWRVTARTGEPHTKLFREERERPALFGVDLRRSMSFATRGAFKSVVACRIAALLAWRHSRHGDRIGGVLWSDQAHCELRPRRGTHGVLGLIRGMCEFAGQDAGPAAGAGFDDLEPAAGRLRRVAHPGSLVFLISDFRGFDEPARDLLARIGRHSTLSLILVHDPIEAELPPPGRYLLRDGDRDLLIDTRAGDRRERYRGQFAQRRDAVAAFCRQSRANFGVCSTHTDPAAMLRRMGG